MEQEVKKTAVDWLVETINKKYINAFLSRVIEQAKEMEKQQIIEAFKNGYELDYISGNRYYTETYENPKS